MAKLSLAQLASWRNGEIITEEKLNQIFTLIGTVVNEHDDAYQKIIQDLAAQKIALAWKGFKQNFTELSQVTGQVRGDVWLVRNNGDDNNLPAGLSPGSYLYVWYDNPLVQGDERWEILYPFTIQNASESTDGLMSKEDFTKLKDLPNKQEIAQIKNDATEGKNQSALNKNKIDALEITTNDHTNRLDSLTANKQNIATNIDGFTTKSVEGNLKELKDIIDAKEIGDITILDAYQLQLESSYQGNDYIIFTDLNPAKRLPNTYIKAYFEYNDVTFEATLQVNEFKYTDIAVVPFILDNNSIDLKIKWVNNLQISGKPNGFVISPVRQDGTPVVNPAFTPKLLKVVRDVGISDILWSDLLDEKITGFIKDNVGTKVQVVHNQNFAANEVFRLNNEYILGTHSIEVFIGGIKATEGIDWEEYSLDTPANSQFSQKIKFLREINMAKEGYVEIRINALVISSYKMTLWNSYDAYTVGTFVIHNSQIWYATKDNVNSEPNENNDDWKRFEARIDIEPILEAIRKLIEVELPKNVEQEVAEQLEKEKKGTLSYYLKNELTTFSSRASLGLAIEFIISRDGYYLDDANPDKPVKVKLENTSNVYDVISDNPQYTVQWKYPIYSDVIATVEVKQATVDEVEGAVTNVLARKQYEGTVISEYKDTIVTFKDQADYEAFKQRTGYGDDAFEPITDPLDAINDRLDKAEADIDNLEAEDLKNVKLMGDQTINGVKTFNESIVIDSPNGKGARFTEYRNQGIRYGIVGKDLTNGDDLTIMSSVGDIKLSSQTSKVNASNNKIINVSDPVEDQDAVNKRTLNKTVNDAINDNNQHYVTLATTQTIMGNKTFSGTGDITNKGTNPTSIVNKEMLTEAIEQNNQGFVTLNTAQTITGAKTFNANTNFNNNIVLDKTSAQFVEFKRNGNRVGVVGPGSSNDEHLRIEGSKDKVIISGKNGIELGSPTKVKGTLDMAGNSINFVHEIGLNYVKDTNGASVFLSEAQGNVVFQKPISMDNRKIVSLANPTENSDAANKQYVDQAVAGVPVVDLTNYANKVQDNTFTANNTFTNPVTVATPTSNLHATTKEYVDNKVTNLPIPTNVVTIDTAQSITGMKTYESQEFKLSRSNAQFIGFHRNNERLGYVGFGSSSDKWMRIHSEREGAIFESKGQLELRVNGQRMLHMPDNTQINLNNKALTNVAAPVNNSDAANKQYVDAKVAAGGGGGNVDLSNYVDKTSNQDITGHKNFTTIKALDFEVANVWNHGKNVKSFSISANGNIQLENVNITNVNDLYISTISDKAGTSQLNFTNNGISAVKNLHMNSNIITNVNDIYVATISNAGGSTKINFSNNGINLYDSVNSGKINMQLNKIENLATPTSDNDAATKKYVDDKVAGGNNVDLSNYVDKTSDQTITGTKTFTKNIILSAIKDTNNNMWFTTSGNGIRTYQDLYMESDKSIYGLPLPTVGHQVANKQYVDQAVAAGGGGVSQGDLDRKADRNNTNQTITANEIRIASKISNDFGTELIKYNPDVHMLEFKIPKISFEGNLIKNVANPQFDQDAATKKYVDDKVAAGGGDYVQNIFGVIDSSLVSSEPAVSHRPDLFFSNTGRRPAIIKSYGDLFIGAGMYDVGGGTNGVNIQGSALLLGRDRIRFTNYDVVNNVQKTSSENPVIFEGVANFVPELYITMSDSSYYMYFNPMGHHDRYEIYNINIVFVNVMGSSPSAGSSLSSKSGFVMRPYTKYAFNEIFTNNPSFGSNGAYFFRVRVDFKYTSVLGQLSAAPQPMTAGSTFAYTTYNDIDYQQSYTLKLIDYITYGNITTKSSTDTREIQETPKAKRLFRKGGK